MYASQVLFEANLRTLDAVMQFLLLFIDDRRQFLFKREISLRIFLILSFMAATFRLSAHQF